MSQSDNNTIRTMKMKDIEKNPELVKRLVDYIASMGFSTSITV